MKETAYFLQAALISAWWICLASSSEFFAAFQYAGFPPETFWSFLAPDLILIASLSLFRAYQDVRWIEYVVLGAFGYAALYCGNATVLTRSGYLPTTIMMIGLAYNLFLCFHRSMFRQSRSSLFGNVFKTLVQIVCIWILSLGVIPYIILTAFGQPTQPELGFTLWMGLALFLASSTLGLTSSYFMVRHGSGTPLPLDQTNQLVVSGPYRYVRNPMAIAGIGQGLAIAIVFRSLPIALYALVGAVVWHSVVRPAEERDLARRFGGEFEEYRASVRCWLP